MSLQESHEQFEHEVDETVSDSQDSVVHAAESELVEQQPSKPEAVSVPSPRAVPASSETSIHTEGVDGPAWYVIHCYS